MVTPAPPSDPTPAQPPVAFLYTLPVGAVVPWIPPPDAYQAVPGDANAPKQLVYPPGFAPCNGQVIDDPDSPFNGMALPNFVDRVALGSDGTMPPGTMAGDTGFNVSGWTNPMLTTSPTVAADQDNQTNNIIQHNNPTTQWRYTLTDNDDDINDGNHHHYLAAHSFGVPAPGTVSCLMIMRIK